MTAFHTYFYLVAEAAALVVNVLAFVITLITVYVKYHKGGYPKRDSCLHGAYTGFLVVWMCTPLFPWVSTAFNGINWVGAWVIMSFIWITGFLLIIKGKTSYDNGKYKSTASTFFQSIMNGIEQLGWLKLGVICLSFIGAAWVMTFFIYNVCVGIHPFRVTSEISRRMSGPSCKTGTVCNFILTVPEDVSVSMIANYHSQDAPSLLNASSTLPASFVFYDTVSHYNEYKSQSSIDASNFTSPYKYLSNSTFFKMDNIKEEDRYVHWADLVNLTPNTTYYIAVGYQSQGSIYLLEEKKFKTAPNDGSPFTLITGGDMEQSEDGFKLSSIAGESDPIIAMIGGDLAYDSGQACCYKLWDEWFAKYDTYFTSPNGYSIPLLAAIGNHESTGWKTERTDVQFYTQYLPQQTNLQSTEPINRPLYHAHYIGNDTMIMTLDSEVVEKSVDQNQWMIDTFTNPLYSDKLFKLAMYHIAIYPCTEVSLDTDITNDARTNWSPIFDSNNLTVAYENHYHLYKRTKQMKNDQPDPQGTVYIGDGAWGVPTVLSIINYSYLEQASQTKNIIRTTINPSTRTFKLESINPEGEIFDQFTRTL